MQYVLRGECGPSFACLEPHMNEWITKHAFFIFSLSLMVILSLVLIVFMQPKSYCMSRKEALLSAMLLKGVIFPCAHKCH